jgi:ABC-2 type transport system ATP-binding protein
MTAQGQPVISAQGLTKRFGELEAVKGIDLVVQPGEIFGFLGPNGAGKSTTINMLCTLLKVSAGTASVAGFDVMRQPDDVRSSIGLVFQEASLDLQLTARENLQFHAFVYGVPASQRAARIAQVLEMVELTDRASSLVLTFSGGMRRRLEIARGMLHTPEVLFLDEPTIGLDPQTRRHIWTYLRGLRESAGVTLFMTTHYMDEAEECDRIAVIDGGRIVALGTPEELKALVGGDVVTIATNDNVAAAAEIEQHFSITPVAAGESLHLEVPEAAAFVPRLVRETSVPITSISFRRPSLDDVFLKLTGHAIRDEAAGSNDMMRMMGRAWGGRR